MLTFFYFHIVHLLILLVDFYIHLCAMFDYHAFWLAMGSSHNRQLYGYVVAALQSVGSAGADYFWYGSGGHVFTTGYSISGK